jgi:hypothetical protein
MEEPYPVGGVVSDTQLFVNGVDGSTGSYLLPPLSTDMVSRHAMAASLDLTNVDELRWRHQQATESVFGPGEGRDPRELSEVGWGVVFATDTDPAVRDALRMLLDHRRQQATRSDERYYREFWGQDGYRPGESKSQFLVRHGAGPGPVDPARVPYYLLLVGSGSQIPFSVQYQLDVQHAVGRLHFDTAIEYRRYAASVVAAETGRSPSSRRLSFFAPQNCDDRATALSVRDLVAPLATRVAATNEDWEITTVTGAEATKKRLMAMVGGEETPALIFTAGHGVGWPAGHPKQLRQQGALVCQDWPGPEGGTGLTDDDYLSADDVSDEAKVHGLLAFHFACFGAGTPEWNDFNRGENGPTPARLAPRPLVSSLPQRLLGHPRGGALAVAGHIDRAWSYSFSWPGSGHQTEVYRSCLERLLRGYPIGSAFDYVNERYAELSSDLFTALEEVKYGRRPDHLSLAALWTANNDARGFVVIGDPAVRIPSPHGAGPSTDAPAEDPPAANVHGIVATHAQPAQEQHQPEGRLIDSPPRDDLDEARERLAAAVRSLATTLEQAASDLEVIEVVTYSSEDLEAAPYDPDTGRFVGARQRARSRLGVAGDITTVVLEREPGTDAEITALHLELLAQAQRSRQELLGSLGTTLRTLLETVIGLNS